MTEGEIQIRMREGEIQNGICFTRFGHWHFGFWIYLGFLEHVLPGGRVGRHPARIYFRWDMGKPLGFSLASFVFFQV